MHQEDLSAGAAVAKAGVVGTCTCVFVKSLLHLAATGDMNEIE